MTPMIEAHGLSKRAAGDLVPVEQALAAVATETPRSDIDSQRASAAIDGGADPTVAAPYVRSRSGASFTVAARATARRTILQFFRTPQVLLLATIQSAFVLFLFRYIFGGAIDTIGPSRTWTSSSPATWRPRSCGTG
jgi:hypothetical protein